MAFGCFPYPTAQIPYNEKIQIRKPTSGTKRLIRVMKWPDALTCVRARLLRRHQNAEAFVLREFGVHLAPKPVSKKGRVMNGVVTTSRISYLKILALSLLREIASAEDMGEGQNNDTLDLHAEVRRFETELIRSALIQTGGRQRQAARLLGTKVTTLNTKIKRYKIEISDHGFLG